MAKRRARRWELTEEELRRIKADRPGSVSVVEIARTLIGEPSLVLPLARAAAAGAVSAVRNDGALISIVEGNRIRSVVPDAATGAHWHGEQFFVDMVAAHVGEDASALEIGCGGGRITRLIAPSVRHLVAADVSQVLLDEARTNLAAVDNVRFIQTAGFTLSEFPDASFDAVYSHDVFVQFELNETLAMLDSARRVLRGRGICVVSFVTIDRPAWSKRQLEVVRAAARLGRFGRTVRRPYTAAQIEALYRAAGFDVIDTRYASLDDDADPAHFVAVGQA